MSSGPVAGGELVLQHGEADRGVGRATRRPPNRDGGRPGGTTRRSVRTLNARRVTSSMTSIVPDDDEAGGALGTGVGAEEADEGDGDEGRGDDPGEAAAAPQGVGEDQHEQRADDEAEADAVLGVGAAAGEERAAVARPHRLQQRGDGVQGDDEGDEGPLGPQAGSDRRRAGRAAGGQQRADGQPDGPRDEVLDVPEETDLQQHAEQVGGDADADPAAPHRLHDRGEGGERGEATGGDADVDGAAELGGPDPSAALERPEEQRRHHGRRPPARRRTVTSVCQWPTRRS